MVQLILEQLVNGMSPAATSPNNASQPALAMIGAKVIVQELPRINFIRSFRIFFRIIGENLAAYSIGKVDKWDQLFSDGTGRRQTALHNLSSGVINEERLRTLIISTSIILKGEASDQQVDGGLSTIAGCRK